VFLKIAPFADDVWFYAMGLLNDTPFVKTYARKPNGDYVELSSTYDDALFAKNTDPNNCQNDVQIKAVFEKYGLYDKLKVKDNK
jgi:hypothetical protein